MAGRGGGTRGAARRSLGRVFAVRTVSGSASGSPWTWFSRAMASRAARGPGGGSLCLPSMELHSGLFGLPASRRVPPTGLYRAAAGCWAPCGGPGRGGGQGGNWTGRGVSFFLLMNVHEVMSFTSLVYPWSGLLGTVPCSVGWRWCRVLLLLTALTMLGGGVGLSLGGCNELRGVARGT